jgi:hypothetical protein
LYEPAVANVRLNFAPGAIEPEFHEPSSPVDVCVVVSLLVHVTVPPALITTGFGAYAVVVLNSAPLTTETGVPELLLLSPPVDGPVGADPE